MRTHQQAAERERIALIRAIRQTTHERGCSVSPLYYRSLSASPREVYTMKFVGPLPLLCQRAAAGRNWPPIRQSSVLPKRTVLCDVVLYVAKYQPLTLSFKESQREFLHRRRPAVIVGCRRRRVGCKTRTKTPMMCGPRTSLCAQHQRAIGVGAVRRTITLGPLRQA